MGRSDLGATTWGRSNRIPTANIDYTRKWYLIQQQPLLIQIFKETPIISYRKGHSLKDILVRAKI